MVRVTSINLEVPNGTKIQDLITALKELEETYHNINVGSFDYDTIFFNIEDKKDVEEN